MANNNITKSVPQLQVSKRDQPRRKFSQSDDSTLVKQAKETHNSESHYVNVIPVLSVVENILRLSSPVIQGTTEDHLLASHEKISAESFGDEMLEGLSNIIHRISCEMFCKCSGGEAHASTMSIFKLLLNSPWEAKAVLALAGFSVTYGEFWLVAQLCTTSTLAKAVAQLKQVSDIVENSQLLKPQLDAISSLVTAAVNVTKRIVEFTDLSTDILSQDSTQVSAAKAHIPAAVYWTIRSIIACAWHISSLTEIQYEHMGSVNSELWELSSFAHKLNTIHDTLATELDLGRKYIAERRYEEEYRILVRLIESSHLDNMKILKALISTREDKPLLFGTQKTTVSIEVLRRKHVLLLISDLSLSDDEIAVLDNFYDMRMNQETQGDHRRSKNDIAPYEIVWIPMVDRVKTWNEDRQKKFDDLVAQMPWHCVHSPNIIEPPAVKYIREKWNFENKMIVVSLDPMGKVSSTNAMNMMWIWGNHAFPFSLEREEALWATENWTPHFVIDGIDTNVLQWFSEEKYICLYGGEDMEWIREFTIKARAAAEYLQIPLQIIYVGKRNITRERLRKIVSVIEAENLSKVWSEYTAVWYFWSRIDAMRCSKARFGKTIDSDAMLKEVMVLLSYDGSDQGWVTLWGGTGEVMRANGSMAILALREFEQWQQEAAAAGLVAAMNEELMKRHTPQHCTRLILPGIGEDIPRKVTCTECGRDMEKFFMFRCCTD